MWILESWNAREPETSRQSRQDNLSNKITTCDTSLKYVNVWSVINNAGQVWAGLLNFVSRNLYAQMSTWNIYLPILNIIV